MNGPFEFNFTLHCWRLLARVQSHFCSFFSLLRKSQVLFNAFRKTKVFLTLLFKLAKVVMMILHLKWGVGFEGRHYAKAIK